MKKRFVALSLVGALALGTCTVSAANGTRNISATFRNIKIVVDGKQLSTSAEPFIYNGTTYLPIRAVGEAVGKEVTWNGSTNTVYLGEVPASAQQPATPAPAASGDMAVFMRYADELGVTKEDLSKGPEFALEIYAYMMNVVADKEGIQALDAAYAEGQAVLARYAGNSNYAGMKKTLDEQYSYMRERVQKAQEQKQEQKQAQQEQAAAADEITKKYPAIVKSGWEAKSFAKFVARIEAGEVSAWDIYDEFWVDLFLIFSDGDFQLAEDVYKEAQELIDLSVDKADNGNFDRAEWKKALEDEYKFMVEQFS